MRACFRTTVQLHGEFVHYRVILWHFSCICVKLVFIFFDFSIVIWVYKETLVQRTSNHFSLCLSSIIAATSLVSDCRWLKAIGMGLRDCLCKERKPVLFSAKKKKKSKKCRCTVSVLRLLSAAACPEAECRQPIQLWRDEGAPSVER